MVQRMRWSLRSGSERGSTTVALQGPRSPPGRSLVNAPVPDWGDTIPVGMRLLVTGGTGVLGRALCPVAEAEGHEISMPGHDELDLFDPDAVADAVRDVDAVLH